MKYPQPLKKGDTIGITATSTGVTGVFAKRLDNAITQLTSLGYQCIETPSVRNTYKLTSADSKTRAKEFLSLYYDDRVKAIIPPWGGEFLMDMLPYLDFNEIKKATPKWILGFSDTSTLLFSLTLNCDIATAHGTNMLAFGANPIHSETMNALDILQSQDEFEQMNFEYYQKDWLNVNGNPFIPYNLTEKVEWKILGGDKANFEGRLIGGNLDVICKLIATPYDSVRSFIEKYAESGIIWYFESCEMKSTDIYRTLWQMKMNGWFKNCAGFLFGRADGYNDKGDFTLVDSLKYPLEDLGVPVIYDADIGHLPPQITLINGAFASVMYQSGKAKIIQKCV